MKKLLCLLAFAAFALTAAAQTPKLNRDQREDVRDQRENVRDRRENRRDRRN